jgi:hypothetical protein
VVRVVAGNHGIRGDIVNNLLQLFLDKSLVWEITMVFARIAIILPLAVCCGCGAGNGQRAVLLKQVSDDLVCAAGAGGNRWHADLSVGLNMRFRSQLIKFLKDERVRTAELPPDKGGWRVRYYDGIDTSETNPKIEVVCVRDRLDIVGVGVFTLPGDLDEEFRNLIIEAGRETRWHVID